jgi:hypothetical protein
MNTPITQSDAGGEGASNEKVIAMLTGALEKARKGIGRSAVLMTLKPNGIDLTGQFTHPDDLPAAIAECDKLKATLAELLNKGRNSTGA